MEIIVGNTAGFCFGVKRAVDGAEEILLKEKEIYCLGEIVHNKDVIEELEEKGLKYIEDINEGKNKVIIRAHGVGKHIYTKAKDLGIELIDLTCPKVIKIHDTVEKYANDNFYIFLIGKKNHPEIIGTVDYCGNKFCVIENIQDAIENIEKFNQLNYNKLLVISQTTYSLKEFNSIIEIIQEKIKKGIKLDIKNTICHATRLRQEETIKIANQVDLMIIIGGRNSSNTNKIYEEAKKYTKTILIENKKEIEIEKMQEYQKIGIMAGASTSKKSIDETVELLQSI